MHNAIFTPEIGVVEFFFNVLTTTASAFTGSGSGSCAGVDFKNVTGASSASKIPVPSATVSTPPVSLIVLNLIVVEFALTVDFVLTVSVKMSDVSPS